MFTSSSLFVWIDFHHNNCVMVKKVGNKKLYVFLLSGFFTYLAMEHNIRIPHHEYWYCALSIPILFMSFLCSSNLIVAMTFERFYSIIRPHKAASFNTVKRAKIIIVCIFVFSIMYNVPHAFTTGFVNWQCLPYAKATGKKYGVIYYWVSFLLNFAVPFVLLLSMNSVIIYKIQNRSILTYQRNATVSAEDNNKKQDSKVKNSERQIFTILLLVTFGFLILTTPAYVFMLVSMFVDFTTTPKLYATFYLFYNVAQKMHLTNHGINFFMYVISGKKFRTDLIKLFKRKDVVNGGSISILTENQSI